MPTWLLALIPYLTKIPKLAKTLYKSKAFWPVATTGGLLGATAMSEIGRAGERKMTKEQLKMQQLLGGKSAEAAKQMTKESQARTEQMINRLLQEKRVEASKEREAVLLQSFINSQQQQMADVLQTIESGKQSPFTGGAGLVGLMRSNY